MAWDLKSRDQLTSFSTSKDGCILPRLSFSDKSVMRSGVFCDALLPALLIQFVACLMVSIQDQIEETRMVHLMLQRWPPLRPTTFFCLHEGKSQDLVSKVT